MINRDADPDECALLVDDLEEAHEHLGDLIQKLAGDPTGRILMPQTLLNSSLKTTRRRCAEWVSC
jgi:hypothetical protein